jgi:hypothetical protein
MTIRKARTAAADAARQLLQDRVEVVAELAEAGARIDAKAAAVVQAQTALHDARAEYRAKFAAALALGWTAEQLAETGNPAERGEDTLRSRGRRRRPASSSTQTDATPPSPTQIHTPSGHNRTAPRTAGAVLLLSFTAATACCYGVLPPPRFSSAR